MGTCTSLYEDMNTSTIKNDIIVNETLKEENKNQSISLNITSDIIYTDEQPKQIIKAAEPNIKVLDYPEKQLEQIIEDTFVVKSKEPKVFDFSITSKVIVSKNEIEDDFEIIN